MRGLATCAQGACAALPAAPGRLQTPLVACCRGAGILEHLEPSVAASYYKRIAQHYAASGAAYLHPCAWAVTNSARQPRSNATTVLLAGGSGLTTAHRLAMQSPATGSLAEAEGFWLKAGLPMEAVDMHLKAGGRARVCVGLAVGRGGFGTGNVRRRVQRRARPSTWPARPRMRRRVGRGAKGGQGLPARARAAPLTDWPTPTRFHPTRVQRSDAEHAKCGGGYS